MLNTIKNVQLIENILINSRGSDINVIENIDHFFKTKRIFFVNSSIKEEIRGEHAHKIDSQIVGCVSGKISFTVDDGNESKNYILNKNSEFLFIPTNIWTTTKYLMANTVVMVLCSGNYDEKSYIRNYNEFKKYVSSYGV